MTGDGKVSRYVTTGFGAAPVRGNTFKILGYGFGRFFKHLKIQIDDSGGYGFIRPDGRCRAEMACGMEFRLGGMLNKLGVM